MADVLHAILLGIIEGVTEFLPISSTGHLIITEKYIHFHDDAKLFTIVVQVGATLAVLYYYRKDIAKKIAGLFGGETKAVQFWTNILLAIIPAGLLGLALDKSFEKYAKPGVVAAALIAGGVVLWLVDRRPDSRAGSGSLQLENISRKQAIVVGLVQCFALVPGVSRSGATIVGGLLGGLNRLTATTFSFYAGIPLLLSASAYKLAKDHNQLSTISGGSLGLALGTLASFVAGLLAVSWLLKYISSHNLRLFAYYRIVLGICVLALL